MPALKNLRHGRIRILSGDATPLEKVAEWTNGDFQWTEGFPTNVVRDRGKTRGFSPGDDEPVNWSFSAKLTDKTLYRCLRDKVWDGQAESLTGLTASSNNTVTLSYDYEQGSLQMATGETGTKLANGATPTADNEFAEATGAEDLEGVTKVAKANGLQVFQPAADTDRDITYDAVGASTLPEADCPGRKGVLLILEIFDPCDGPDPDDLAAGTIAEKYKINKAVVTQIQFGEGDEADVLSFSGTALINKVDIETV